MALSNLSGCCVGVINLRNGSQIFAAICIINNMSFGFTPPSWWSWPAAITSIVAAIWGLYGIHVNNTKFIRQYLVVYVAASIISFSLDIIRLQVDRQGKIESVCHYSPRYEACYQHNMARGDVSLIISSTLYMILVLWVVLLTGSLIQIIDQGGTGREFMSPKRFQETRQQQHNRPIVVAVASINPWNGTSGVIGNAIQLDDRGPHLPPPATITGVQTNNSSKEVVMGIPVRA